MSIVFQFTKEYWLKKLFYQHTEKCIMMYLLGMWFFWNVEKTHSTISRFITFPAPTNLSGSLTTNALHTQKDYFGKKIHYYDHSVPIYKFPMQWTSLWSRLEFKLKKEHTLCHLMMGFSSVNNFFKLWTQIPWATPESTPPIP